MLSLAVLLLAIVGAIGSIWVTRDWDNPLIGWGIGAIFVAAAFYYFLRKIGGE